MKDLEVAYKRAFTSNDIGSKRTNFVTMAEVTHKFNDQWTSRTSYQRGEANENESIFLVLRYLNDKQVERMIRPFDSYKITTDNIQQNFTGDFKIGNLRNRLVVGIDYFQQTSKYQFPYYEANGYSNVFMPYDKVNLDSSSAWDPISRNKFRNTARKSTESDITRFRTVSAYVSDVLNITDNLLVMASLRVDSYKNDDTIINGVEISTKNGYAENKVAGYSQTQFSPKFGLVYEIVKDQISFFANYVNGFKNYAPSLNEVGVLTKWDPEQGNQVEAGFKLDLFNKKLLTTISYYNINVKNRLVADPGGIGSIQDGNIKSQGAEIGIIANPVKGWNIVAGYGYNDNKYNDRSKDSGKRIAWTPKHVANLWTSYKIMDGAYEGLGFGAGFNFVDQSYINIINHFLAPAYTTVGATVFYDKKKYRIGLKMNNALNQMYWNFYGQPQKPREVLANFAFKF